MTQAVQVAEPVAWHGEGPVWHEPWGLVYVDMLAGDILRLDPGSGAVRRNHVGSVAAVVRPRTNGGAVVAVERGFALIDPGTPPEEARHLGDLWTGTSVRMNEGGCDPDGRFYCGSMAYDKSTGAGSVYRLDPDGSTRTVLTGVTVSNGLGWSPDGGTAYYVDTPTRRIDAFDYSARDGLTGRRPLVAEVPGRPDGLTVDAEGYLWVALFGGGAVLRYRHDGRLDDRIELPVTQVTACALGGPGLRTLYVTTSKDGIDPAAQPLAGAAFAAQVDVPGLPVLPYAG
ncbi:MAG TPA: SMP-30/gluconolactonase/LRE family protein [Streptosporangiaceae bacterium]|jgi:sugar lactone lactonase YvrE